MFEARCRAVRIPFGRQVHGLTFHGLRHTGASRMLNQGVDIKTVAEIGNWKNLAVLQRYLHPIGRPTGRPWRPSAVYVPTTGDENSPRLFRNHAMSVAERGGFWLLWIPRIRAAVGRRSTRCTAFAASRYRTLDDGSGRGWARRLRCVNAPAPPGGAIVVAQRQAARLAGRPSCADSTRPAAAFARAIRRSYSASSATSRASSSAHPASEVAA